jgi:hypothetical protein
MNTQDKTNNGHIRMLILLGSVLLFLGLCNDYIFPVPIVSRCTVRCPHLTVNK